MEGEEVGWKVRNGGTMEGEELVRRTVWVRVSLSSLCVKDAKEESQMEEEYKPATQEWRGKILQWIVEQKYSPQMAQSWWPELMTSAWVCKSLSN